MNDDAMKLFGITLEVGSEYRMGWYHHTFVFADPIAGIERLETGMGRPRSRRHSAASSSPTASRW